MILGINQTMNQLESEESVTTYAQKIQIQVLASGVNPSHSADYLVRFHLPIQHVFEEKEPVFVQSNKDGSQFIQYEIKRMIHKKPYPITWHGKELYLIKDNDEVLLVDKIDKD